jgi:pantetheine-phosphate adenylyltransferase
VGKAVASEPKAIDCTCVYAGSFDPPTLGHYYMIREGAKRFRRLVVAIGSNSNKESLFTTEEKRRMLVGITKGLPNVSVASYENMFLVKFAEKIGAGCILRGIRNEDDYRYERSMRQTNEDMNKDITAFFLMPPNYLTDISSSTIKGFIGVKGWEDEVKKYVPPEVYEELLAKAKLIRGETSD